MKVLCKKDFCLISNEYNENNLYRKGILYEIEYEEELTYCIMFNRYHSVHFIKKKSK